jgi:hypothetical protein
MLNLCWSAINHAAQGRIAESWDADSKKLHALSVQGWKVIVETAHHDFDGVYTPLELAYFGNVSAAQVETLTVTRLP